MRGTSYPKMLALVMELELSVLLIDRPY